MKPFLSAILLLTFAALVATTGYGQCPGPSAFITSSGATTFCAGGSITLTARNDAWTQKANFNGGTRLGAVGFSIGSKGYVGTGFDVVSDKNDFWEYDPLTNVWAQKANVAGGTRRNATGFSIGNKGYVGTGTALGSPKADFWEYDAAANTWTAKTDVPGGGREHAVGFNLGTKGYVGTGNNTSDFWEYDPAINSWVQKADFGGGLRNYATGFAIGSAGYVGLGISNGAYQNDFWRYTPGTNTWVRMADFGGSARFEAAGFGIAGKGYMGTGYSPGATPEFLKDFWEYDPATNSWLRKNDFGGTGRLGSVGFAIGSKGYVGLGNEGSNVYRNDFWEYNPGVSPATYSWTPGGQTTSSIVVSASGNYGVTITTTLGCVTTSAVTTVVSVSPTATISGSTSVCQNAATPSISFTGAGGTPPYTFTYKINGGANQTVTTTSGNSISITAPTAAAGFFTYSLVSVQESSALACSQAQTGAALITVTAAPAAVITASGTTTLCGGGDVTLTATAVESWTSKTALNGSARFAAVGFSILGKGYIGMGADANTYKSDFWEYDPSTGAWTQKAGFPGGNRASATAFSIGSKGYVGTGSDINGGRYNDFWEYDPGNNSWTAKAAFAGVARQGAVGFAIGTRGYIGTGSAAGSIGLGRDIP